MTTNKQSRARRIGPKEFEAMVFEEAAKRILEMADAGDDADGVEVDVDEDKPWEEAQLAKKIDHVAAQKIKAENRQLRAVNTLLRRRLARVKRG